MNTGIKKKLTSIATVMMLLCGTPAITGCSSTAENNKPKTSQKAETKKQDNKKQDTNKQDTNKQDTNKQDTNTNNNSSKSDKGN